MQHALTEQKAIWRMIHTLLLFFDGRFSSSLFRLQVRRWDVATGINTDTYNGSKVVASVASSSSNPDVVAFGGSDRVLRIWDSRSSKGEGLAVQVSKGEGLAVQVSKGRWEGASMGLQPHGMDSSPRCCLSNPPCGRARPAVQILWSGR